MLLMADADALISANVRRRQPRSNTVHTAVLQTCEERLKRRREEEDEKTAAAQAKALMRAQRAAATAQKLRLAAQKTAAEQQQQHLCTTQWSHAETRAKQMRLLLAQTSGAISVLRGDDDAFVVSFVASYPLPSNALALEWHESRFTSLQKVRARGQAEGRLCAIGRAIARATTNQVRNKFDCAVFIDSDYVLRLKDSSLCVQVSLSTAGAMGGAPRAPEQDAMLPEFPFPEEGTLDSADLDDWLPYMAPEDGCMHEWVDGCVE